MNAKKRKIFFVTLTIIIIWSLITIIDYSLSKQNKKPVFAIKIVTHLDGGTIEYYGLGYKIIKYNKLDNRVTNTVGRKDSEFGFWTLKYK